MLEDFTSEHEENENNTCCDNCNSNFQYACEGLKYTLTNDTWLCLVCLTDLPEGTD